MILSKICEKAEDRSQEGRFDLSEVLPGHSKSRNHDHTSASEHGIMDEWRAADYFQESIALPGLRYL